MNKQYYILNTTVLHLEACFCIAFGYHYIAHMYNFGIISLQFYILLVMDSIYTISLRKLLAISTVISRNTSERKYIIVFLNSTICPQKKILNLLPSNSLFFEMW